MLHAVSQLFTMERSCMYSVSVVRSRPCIGYISFTVQHWTCCYKIYWIIHSYNWINDNCCFVVCYNLLICQTRERVFHTHVAAWFSLFSEFCSVNARLFSVCMNYDMIYSCLVIACAWISVLVNFMCGLIQCSSLENICHFLNYHNSLRFGDSSETKRKL